MNGDALCFLGTSVVSGVGQGLVLATGAATRFGAIASKLSSAKSETSFDRGVKDFTYMIIRAMLVLVAGIFVVNAALKGSFVDAFMFSLAVAVGLTPEMMPMIVSVNLSKGAMSMAKKKVIVKQLAAIPRPIGLTRMRFHGIGKSIQRVGGKG